MEKTIDKTKEIVDRIDALRNDYSLSEICKALEISHRIVSYWRNGKRKITSKNYRIISYQLSILAGDGDKVEVAKKLEEIEEQIKNLKKMIKA